MARLDVAPTKSNHMEIRRSLEHAQEGYDLLEQKRQLLVIELVGRLEEARDAQAEVDRKMAEAHKALKRGILRMGSETLQKNALGITLAHSMKIGTQVLMGLRLPRLDVQHEKPGLQFGFSNTSASTDEVLEKVNSALDSVGRFAEVQTTVIRLARELEATQRRVNALEKIFLPDYKETLQYIESELEERERESFTVNKILKRRMIKGQIRSPYRA